MKKVEEVYPVTAITIKRWCVDGTHEKKIYCLPSILLGGRIMKKRNLPYHQCAASKPCKERKVYSGFSH